MIKCTFAIQSKNTIEASTGENNDQQAQDIVHHNKVYDDVILPAAMDPIIPNEVSLTILML